MKQAFPTVLVKSCASVKVTFLIHCQDYLHKNIKSPVLLPK